MLTLALVAILAGQETTVDAPVSPANIAAASALIGASFSAEEIELMLDDVRENLASFEALRTIPLDNAIEPALYFLPRRSQHVGDAVDRLTSRRAPAAAAPLARPADLEDLAYEDILTLHHALHGGTLTCVELAEMFIKRLKRRNGELACVISMTEERALAQARQLDEELAAGKSRGLLHGIPWVAKDLLAVRGTPTTWGARPFEDQTIDVDAAVVEALDEAGAVLIAKVSLGALAWGDVWFGGQTKNPWNLIQGSSGSSAGPASAVAAGCASFGIGSETLGSIVSPSTRCGNSSLRPTFGRVSRYGAMTLSWSMDKLGPICRSAEDAGLVFDAIHGRDERDPTTASGPFDAQRRFDPSTQRIGYLKELEDDERYARVLEELRRLEAELVPVQLPDYPIGDMSFVLSAEAAAAFDEFSASDLDDHLVRQSRDAWPNVFRLSRLIPAVDYLRASRLRTLLIRDMQQALRNVDVLVHPSFARNLLTATNLTGHPTFVAPSGFAQDGTPYSISFTAKLFEESELMSVVRAWQASTDYHLQHPE